MKYLLGIMVALFLLAPRNISGNTENVVEIHAYDPYRWDVYILVKCDWDNKTQNYRFLKRYIIPGKGKAIIRVPNNLRHCECWPKIVF
jgi:hypothetical protein